jgi:phosphonate transport system substrate-binding protein
MDLSTNQIRIYGVGISLDNGEEIEAFLPPGIIDNIMEGIRVRVLPESHSIPEANQAFDWTVVEILPDGVPTPDVAMTQEAEAQKCKLRGILPEVYNTNTEVLDSLAAMISTETGCEVEIQLIPLEFIAVSMLSGEADFVLASFSEYLIVQESTPLIPLYVPSYDTFSGFYCGAFFVPSESDAQNFSDLAGKSFAYSMKGNPYGYLLPRIMIADNGYDVNGFFSTTIQTGTLGIDMINAVLDGNADAGSTWYLGDDNGLTSAQAEIPDIMERVKIIDYTDWIPSNVLFTHEYLPEDSRIALKEALGTIIQSDEGRNIFLELDGINGLNEPDERFWNAVDLITRAKKLDDEFGSW